MAMSEAEIREWLQLPVPSTTWAEEERARVRKLLHVIDGLRAEVVAMVDVHNLTLAPLTERVEKAEEARDALRLVANNALKERDAMRALLADTRRSVVFENEHNSPPYAREHVLARLDAALGVAPAPSDPATPYERATQLENLRAKITGTRDHLERTGLGKVGVTLDSQELDHLRGLLAPRVVVAQLTPEEIETFKLMIAVSDAGAIVPAPDDLEVARLREALRFYAGSCGEKDPKMIEVAWREDSYGQSARDALGEDPDV